MVRTNGSLPQKAGKFKKAKKVYEGVENEKVNREHEKKELERKREAERMGKKVEREMQSHIPQNMSGEHFPLRQAVILSEIVGQPKCKTRNKRKR